MQKTVDDYLEIKSTEKLLILQLECLCFPSFFLLFFQEKQTNIAVTDIYNEMG